jgi:hypothetical protein
MGEDSSRHIVQGTPDGDLTSGWSKLSAMYDLDSSKPTPWVLGLEGRIHLQ